MRFRILSRPVVIQWFGVICLIPWSPIVLRAEDSHVAELIQEGDLEDAHSNPHGALVFFQEADKLNPNNAAILIRISKQYSDLIAGTKPADEAEKVASTSLDFAKRAVEIDPGNAKAHLSVAVGYGKLTDFADNKTKLLYSKFVRAEAEKALALDPSDDYAYHVLGRWNYGVASLNPMLKLMAKFIYGGLPEASFEDAAKYLKKATELAPQRMTHHFQLARVYQAMGKNELAAMEWQTILELHPSNKEDENAQKEAKESLKKLKP